MVNKYAASIEAAEDGTRVNGIAPGIVATNIMGLSAKQTDRFGHQAKQLMGRAGRGEERTWPTL
jgi:NAD(P)-dependent dehydrogenase (short-subunit alcohol dehydrogenase family)